MNIFVVVSVYFTLVKFVLLLTVKGSKLKTCYCVAARESACNFFFLSVLLRCVVLWTEMGSNVKRVTVI